MTTPQTVALPLPSALSGAVATLQSDLQNALDDGSLVVSQIPTADALVVAADAAAVQTAAAALIAGTDATQASPAVDAANSAAVIAGVVASPRAPRIRLRLVNPDLFLLAAQYLGDAQRWQDIAIASSLSPDPQPTGSFQITIPET